MGETSKDVYKITWKKTGKKSDILINKPTLNKEEAIDMLHYTVARLYTLNNSLNFIHAKGKSFKILLVLRGAKWILSVNLPLLLILSIRWTNVTVRLRSTFSPGGGGRGTGAGEGIPLGAAALAQLWWSHRCLCCAHAALNPGLSCCRFRFPSPLVITCRAAESMSLK